ncbi:MAG: methyl-accepting chemotaxis protein, partial [Syntrophothermus sp.]
RAQQGEEKRVSFLAGWKLRTKLLALIGFMILTMVGLGFYSVQNMDKIAHGAGEIFDKHLLGIEYSLMAKTAFLNISTAIYQHITASTSQEFDEYENFITIQRQELEKAIKDFEAHIDTPRELELLNGIRINLAGYQARIQKLLGLSRAGRDKEAREFAIQEVRPFREKAMAQIDELVKFKISRAEERDKKNDALAYSSRINVLVITAIIALISVLVGVWVSRIIVNPVRQVQKVAEALADGDLSKTVDFRGKDEIGVMAVAVNRAVENLRGLVKKVASASEQVASSSQELASTAQAAGQVTQQVAETINQLAKGSSEQARAAQEAGKIVENMSASIEQVAASSQKMAKNATGVATTGEEGRKAVNQAINQMNAVKGTVDHSAVVIKNLGERSREIGRIVEVITNIADQTNLLALNAAIEAARAGEQGRGFAVVADEVRKLAEQSRQAAEQISSLIREIQGETARAVEAMESGTREAAAGADVVAGTGEAFETIIQAVRSVVVQIQEVSAATSQLAAGSRQVVRSVESIAAITEEAAAGAEEVSANAEEQSAAIEEIGSSAESLAEMAQELQKAVGVFRL